jgi:hypothetical protein
MMKLFDRIYLRLRDIFRPVSYDEAYDNGYDAGYSCARAHILQNLKQSSLYNWKSQELRLGYDYAIYIAEKESDD